MSHGELPADVADRLRAEYECTAATALAGPSEGAEAPAPATDRTPRRTRWATHATTLAAAFAAVVLLPPMSGKASPVAR